MILHLIRYIIISMSSLLTSGISFWLTFFSSASLWWYRSSGFSDGCTESNMRPNQFIINIYLRNFRSPLWWKQARKPNRNTGCSIRKCAFCLENLCVSTKVAFHLSGLSGLTSQFLNGTHEFSELVLARMALLMDQSRSVLPLRLAKTRESGGGNTCARALDLSI